MLKNILIGVFAAAAIASPKAAHALPLCDMVSYAVLKDQCVDLTAWSGIDNTPASESLSVPKDDGLSLSGVSVQAGNSDSFEVIGTIQNNSKRTVRVTSATVTLQRPVTYGKKQDRTIILRISGVIPPGKKLAFEEVVNGVPPKDFSIRVDRVEAEQ